MRLAAYVEKQVEQPPGPDPTAAVRSACGSTEVVEEVRAVLMA
jgi:hypothetical protein